MNALYGVSEGKDGIIAICGTGSVAFGKKGNAYARSGGYCYQEGDLGSSYDIGRKALPELFTGVVDFSKVIVIKHPDYESRKENQKKQKANIKLSKAKARRLAAKAKKVIPLG